MCLQLSRWRSPDVWTVFQPPVSPIWCRYNGEQSHSTRLLWIFGRCNTGESFTVNGRVSFAPTSCVHRPRTRCFIGRIGCCIYHFCTSMFTSSTIALKHHWVYLVRVIFYVVAFFVGLRWSYCTGSLVFLTAWQIIIRGQGAPPSR